MHRKKQFGILGVIVFLILLAEVLVFNRQYLVQNFSGLEERSLHLEDGILKQLRYQDGVLFTEGNNPRIRFENVDTQIRSISIKCDYSLSPQYGRVFYRNNDLPFNAKNSIDYHPNYNGNEIILFLPETQFVSDLSINLTNRDKDAVRCLDFVVNPYSKPRFTLPRLTFYLSILVIAIYDIFKTDHPWQKIPQKSWIFSIKQIKEKLGHALKKGGAIILLVAWILLWLLPWTTWLNTLPWLRSGLSLFLFIIPGMSLSMLLARDRFSLLGHFVLGLALSVFWVGALGFTGRILHWPFQYLKVLFALSGFIGLFALIRYTASGSSLYKPVIPSSRTLVLLLFMIVFGIIANRPNQISTDDYSFVAYLTNWQHARQLGFQEVIYGSGTADSLRFWWSMFPMSLALLAEISHLPGLLLIGIYLEPFLVIVAILAIYVFYDDLLPSQDQAIAAMLLQFIFLFLLRQVYQPGMMFLTRPSDDKIVAAFFLTPMFFLSLRYFLEFFHWRSGLLFLLAGLSLAFTHIIILAFSVFIAGIYAVIVTTIRREYAKLAITTVLLILIITPSASLRFIDDAWVARSILGMEPTVDMQDTFTLNTSREESDTVDTLITAIKGTPFYGFNLERIRIILNGVPKNPLLIFLSWSYLWILSLGFLWSLFKLKTDPSAPFIAASSILVLLCAIPYTGWLLGYFFSARMLWRSPWLLPIGLISFTLLRDFFNLIEAKLLVNIHFPIKAKKLLLTWVPVACLILMAGLQEFFFQDIWMSDKKLERYQSRLVGLSELGHYLDKNIEQPSRFVARPGLMNYLPGLSDRAKVVLFRIKEWAPYPIDETEITSLISNYSSTSMEQRIQLLNKYNIQYILTDDPAVNEYYAHNPGDFSAQNFNGYWIIKFRGQH